MVLANKEVELDQHSLRNLKSVEAAKSILKKFDNYCVSINSQLLFYKGVLRNYEEYIKDSRSRLEVEQEWVLHGLMDLFILIFQT